MIMIKLSSTKNQSTMSIKMCLIKPIRNALQDTAHSQTVTTS